MVGSKKTGGPFTCPSTDCKHPINIKHSKISPTYPWKVPKMFHQQFMKEFFLFGGVGEVWGIFPGYVGKIIETRGKCTGMKLWQDVSPNLHGNEIQQNHQTDLSASNFSPKFQHVSLAADEFKLFKSYQKNVDF